MTRASGMSPGQTAQSGDFEALTAWLAAEHFSFATVAGGLRLDLPETRWAFITRVMGNYGWVCRESGNPVLVAGKAGWGQAADRLKTLLKPQLLCLDVDGCLIDTRASFDAVVNRILVHFTGQDVTRAEILALRAESGFNDDNLLAQEIMRRRGVMVALTDILPVFRRFYFGEADMAGLYEAEKPLISQPLLQRLLENYAVCLVTGRNREEVALAYPVLNLPKWVPAVTVDDVPRGKPDPAGIRLAADRAKARRIWMVGDNKDDILAGLAAGAVTLGVGENHRALREAGAAVVLNDINEIEALL